MAGLGIFNIDGQAETGRLPAPTDVWEGGDGIDEK